MELKEKIERLLIEKEYKEDIRRNPPTPTITRDGDAYNISYTFSHTITVCCIESYITKLQLDKGMSLDELYEFLLQQ